MVSKIECRQAQEAFAVSIQDIILFIINGYKSFFNMFSRKLNKICFFLNLELMSLLKTIYLYFVILFQSLLLIYYNSIECRLC